MSDGGLFQWKRQEIDQHRGPVASYSNLQKSLPDPPKDMHWVHDATTREWRLERIVANEDDIVVEVTPVPDDENNEMVLSHHRGYYRHKIQPTDTFQGLCLRYKITPTELRQANGGFSGTNLYFAPDPLRIPKKLKNKDNNNKIIVQAVPVFPVDNDEESPNEKIRQLLLSCPRLARSEARCYLELNDWELKEAIINARDDGF